MGLAPTTSTTATMAMGDALSVALLERQSFSAEQLHENIAAFVGAIQQAKPTGAKGTYMKKVCVTSTMGPGLKLDLSAL